MAIRYSGDVTVRLAWDDQAEAYRGTVAVVECAAPASGDGHGHERCLRHAWRFDGLRISRHLAERIAVDSPEAYDAAAAAAVAFAAHGPVDEYDTHGPTREQGEAFAAAAVSNSTGDYLTARRYRDRWNGWRIGLDGRRVESVRS